MHQCFKDRMRVKVNTVIICHHIKGAYSLPRSSSQPLRTESSRSLSFYADCCNRHLYSIFAALRLNKPEGNNRTSLWEQICIRTFIIILARLWFFFFLNKWRLISPQCCEWTDRKFSRPSLLLPDVQISHRPGRQILFVHSTDPVSTQSAFSLWQKFYIFYVRQWSIMHTV